MNEFIFPQPLSYILIAFTILFIHKNESNYDYNIIMCAMKRKNVILHPMERMKQTEH